MLPAVLFGGTLLGVMVGAAIFFSGSNSAPLAVAKANPKPGVATPVAPVEPLAQASDQPLIIRPAPGLDEQLFLLRVLEVTYDRWPSTLDRGYLQNWLAGTRVRISRIRAVIATRGLDPDVGRLYDDCLSLLDSYETCLANLGAIDRNAVDQAGRDSGKVAEAFINNALDAAGHAEQNGATPKETVGWGVLAGTLGALLENSDRSQHRDQAKRAAVDAEIRKVNTTVVRVKATAEASAERLTHRYGWKDGEAGFDRFRSPVIADYAGRRPRDPFAKVAMALTGTPTDSAVDVMARARACVDAARQVPGGSVYDPFRAEFLGAAAHLAADAVSRELRNSAYSSGPAKSGLEAVRICKTFLAADPADHSKRAHMLLARALASAGRYFEAIDAANAAALEWGRDPYFCYRYARLMSLTNQPDQTATWLGYAYQRGFKDVALVRADPDLANFRTGNPDGYGKMTEVNWTWRVNYGYFNDDIILQNFSPFELTDCHFDIVIRKGAREWRPNLRLASLPPGGSYTFVNVVSIPGSSYDSATASISCAQK